MNNKYDTKGMADMVDKLDKEQYTKDIKIDEFEDIHMLKFTPEDELKHLDVFYEDENEEVDYEKLKQDVVKFLDKVIDAKNENEVDHIMSNYFHTFVEHTKNYKCRDKFIAYFDDKINSNQTIIKGKYIYDVMVTIFIRLLGHVVDDEDTECGYRYSN
jgi:hypothetical protein